MGQLAQIGNAVAGPTTSGAVPLAGSGASICWGGFAVFSTAGSLTIRANGASGPIIGFGSVAAAGTVPINLPAGVRCPSLYFAITGTCTESSAIVN